MTDNVVCVTTAGRTGSNFLCDVYVQNGFSRFREVADRNFFAFDKKEHITTDGEGGDHITFQNNKYVVNNATLSKVVFHNHDPAWIPHISKDKLKVILQFRKDKVSQHLSHIVWQYMDKVLNDDIKSKIGPLVAPNPDYTSPIKIDKLYVDHRELSNAIRKICKFEDLALKTVQENDIDYSIIYYEDLFSDKQSTILQKLDINYQTKSWFQKGRFQASDIIENYEELKAFGAIITKHWNNRKETITK